MALLCASALSLAQSSPPDPAIPAASAAAFGAREDLRNAALSPDGTKAALIFSGPGQSAELMVADLVAGGRPKLLTRSTGDPERLVGCDWTNTTRLICTVIFRENIDGRFVSFTRLFAINSNGTDLKLISARGSPRALGLMQNGGQLIDWGGDGANGTALVTRQFVPNFNTGTRVIERRDGLGVELIDTVTLARKVVEPARDTAVEYISDGFGGVRIMGLRPRQGDGYDGSTIIYYYRKRDSRDWEKLGEWNVVDSTGFDPRAVDRDLNVVYGFEGLDGRQALYKISLDGTLAKTLVYSRPDVDIDGLIRVGRHQRVVGASYVTDRRLAEIFDPAVKAQRNTLSRVLPGRLLNFADASVDEKQLLVIASSDVDPGNYYFYDKAARKLEILAPIRPHLGKLTLSQVQAVTYPAADGTMIPGYLTLPPGVTSPKGIPAIVMPHGGPGARDEWGFDWLSQFYANRGYAVLQPNFRGSTGYGDAWFQKNGFQSWRVAVGDVNDGGTWLVKQGIADPRKLAIVGWSYGGYAALQSPALNPDLFKAIVAIAPVTDLDMLREESRGFTNFPQVDVFIGRGAHLKEGSPARNAATIRAPVLLFHGNRDTNVGVGESRIMADRLRGAKAPVEYVEFDGLDHYLEDTAARTRMLSTSDAFLRKTMGIPAS
jgi:dienelactone hydrolase